ncbi:MAG: cation-transporting P-type ATPase [Vicinamibacterales bacterium]
MSSSSWTPHGEPIEAVLARLETRRSGLTAAEAASRLARTGPNRLPPPRRTSALAIAVAQLRSVVVALLAAAAVTSAFLGERLDAVAIVAVLLINTGLGFVTELRARRAIDALLHLDTGRAHVYRDGSLHAVDAHALVPGDVIQLDAGQQVPADARLIHATDLRTDEAALTGESLPVSKRDEVLPVPTPLADRHNLVFKGTSVIAGTALAVVTMTGVNTEIGRIGTLVSGVRDEPTPLERRLDTLGKRLVWIALGIAAAVMLLGLFQGVPWSLVIRMGLALAVAAVPEALPAVATIALAVGVHRMARRKALVRRLPAVEALGSTTVICTDKTRTLTSGDMTAARVWTRGRGVALDDGDAAARAPEVLDTLSVAALASRAQPRGDGQHVVGDPVDVAMIRAALGAGLDLEALEAKHPVVGLVPFSSDLKIMATFRETDGTLVAYVKGAPGHVLDRCGRDADGALLDEAAREALHAVNAGLAADGLRVLAAATGDVTASTEHALAGLTFVGFVGLMDPPAAGVREAIIRLRTAGLRTVMLTGDQRLTAEAVGRALGLLAPGAHVIDGSEIGRLSPASFAEAVASAAAFSRITPADKLAIVTALQARGEIVAMLGDGVNDAPALRKADVGVAMGGRGTDVAKEAAAIVLQDDRFETITAAVEEGRVIFDNIRKFVFYLFSCNLAEVLVFLVAGLAGLPLPLHPLQLLWLNMVTDTFPALALAMEPGDPDVMRRPPRDPREAILSAPFLWSLSGHAALIAAVTLAGFLVMLRTAPDRAVTIAFMTLALSQTFHLGNARGDAPVLTLSRALSNRYALAAVALSVGLQCAAMYVTPLARVLHVVPISGRDWVLVLVLAGIPAVLGQLQKLRRSMAKS